MCYLQIFFYKQEGSIFQIWNPMREGLYPLAWEDGQYFYVLYNTRKDEYALFKDFWEQPKIWLILIWFLVF